MKNSYDAIVIGGGHNGLVTAAYLAKAQQRVLLLERRASLGGAAATEEPFPGYRVSTGASDAGLFRGEIISDLGLENHGLRFSHSPVELIALQPDGGSLILWADLDKTCADIKKHSALDAEKYPVYQQWMRRVSGVLESMLLLTPPDPAEQLRAREVLPWIGPTLKLRGLGKKDMMEFLRVLPMSATEFLDSWFESDVLKGALGAAAVAGSHLGPWASGTTLLMLYAGLRTENGASVGGRFVRGGIGQLSNALADVARQHGAEIHTGIDVERIRIEGGKATGVALASGEHISAGVVISNADPRQTLFRLVGAPHLPLKVVRRVKNIRFRGATAKLNLATDRLPTFNGISDPERLSGHILISPSLEYLERASDDAKYGRVSKRPFLDIVIPTILDPSLAPAGKHILSITMQYAPFDLRGRAWDDQREDLADHILETLTAYSPQLKESLLHRQVLTPLDWEREYGLPEGNVHHGEMGLDQLAFMRPIPGFGRYRMPIAGLYLCGAGAHPGGGVTGAPGYNAAREVLHDLQA